MSYILDALRKVEQQARGRVPTLTTVQAPPPTLGRRPWTFAVLAVASGAVVAGLVMAVVFWRAPARPPVVQREPKPVATEPPAAAPSAGTVAAPAPTPAGRAVPAPTQPAAPAGSSPARTASVPAAPTSTARGRPTPSVTAPESPPTRSAAAPHPPSPADETAARKPAAEAGKAPTSLHLEVLVYADPPGSRLVFINGRKYVEGDVVDGAYKIVAIRPDAVVLDNQGQRVVLRGK
jgi:hypothetical protein